jgi:hypothetical protein
MQIGKPYLLRRLTLFGVLLATHFVAKSRSVTLVCSLTLLITHSTDM